MNNRIPLWNRTLYAERLPVLKKRAKIIETIRRFFIERDFLEVEDRKSVV